MILVFFYFKSFGVFEFLKWICVNIKNINKFGLFLWWVYVIYWFFFYKIVVRVGKWGSVGGGGCGGVIRDV